MKNSLKNQKYWEDRIILKDKLLEKDINKIEKDLLKTFKNARKEVLDELKIAYVDVQNSEYTKNRLVEVLKSIDVVLDKLYQENEEKITEVVIDLYGKIDKEASIDLGVSFNLINEDLIREVIKTNWSGLSFSERIWEHRRKLALTLKEELTRGFIRGDSLQEISKRMTDKLNNSYSNAIRLVRTESCWVMNEATVNNYKENGIEKYKIMAFLDNKTSKICREKDGEVVNVKDAIAGKNMPPFH